MAAAQTIRGQRISQEFHLPESLRAALWDLTSTMQEYHYRPFRSTRYSPPPTVLWPGISRSSPLMPSFLRIALT